MWFYCKTPTTEYKIYKSQSDNGIDWEPFDTKRNPELQPSGAPWESKMVEYAYPFVYKDDIYVFYNGNNYGRNDIGVAMYVSA